MLYAVFVHTGTMQYFFYVFGDDVLFMLILQVYFSTLFNINIYLTLNDITNEKLTFLNVCTALSKSMEIIYRYDATGLRCAGDCFLGAWPN